VAGVAAQAATQGHAGAISKIAHKTVKAVTDDISKLAFNKAVARLYELVNAIYAPVGALSADSNAALTSALREAIEMLALMIAPMMPHLAEECWAALGGKGMAADQPWPVFDPALVVDNEITMPVQVNGKKRGDLTIARDADQAAVEGAALALEGVIKALEGKAPRKVIVVPQRIVNVVV
jgi:leucyl-tRNA synthetase